MTHPLTSPALWTRALAASAGLAAFAAAQLPPPPPPPPPPPVAPAPAGNPVTVSKTNLGMALFFEEQMSSDQTMACATCHIHSAGGSDPRTPVPNSGSVHPGPDGLFLTPDDILGRIFATFCIGK